MQHLFSDTTQSMETIEHNSNSIVFSSLSEFYCPIHSTGFAIKYVLEGSELYKMDGQDYLINSGSYFMSNSIRKGHVEIESRKNVKGICLNISPALMAEVVSSMRRPDTHYPDAELAQFFCTAYFPENNYKADTTIIGKELNRLSSIILQQQLHTNDLNIEFFYGLAQKIVADQLPVFKQLQSLPGIKRPTKRELYKKLCRAKEMIDSEFTRQLSIESIAKEICLSQFHFYRLFKLMMGISPHQYILKKRLELAKNLLQIHGLTVSAAAIDCGFADIHSFSKAFKKQYNVNPSAV